MNPKQVLDAVERALDNSTEFANGTIIHREPDYEVDTQLVQPFVSLKPMGLIRAVEWDSDLAGYVRDDAGNKQGRKFQADWQMNIVAHVIIAAANQDLDITLQGHDFRQALLPYDNQQEGQGFPDGNNGTVGDIDSFRLGDGERDDESAGPGKHRWRQEMQVVFHSVRTTDDPRITTVDFPSTKDFSTDSTEDAELVWTPP